MYQTGRLNKLFHEKNLVVGTHIRSQDPCITELLTAVGFDVVWIENEHSNLDKYQTTLHIMAAQAEGAAAIVRLPWNDPVLAKPILELGPDGVVFPMINSEEEARKAVASCIYPPKGMRGMGPIRSNHYGLVSNEEYISNSDSQVFKIMQIEHKKGVENIRKILKVEGVDGIVVGQFLKHARNPEWYVEFRQNRRKRSFVCGWIWEQISYFCVMNTTGYEWQQEKH